MNKEIAIELDLNNRRDRLVLNSMYGKFGNTKERKANLKRGNKNYGSIRFYDK